MRDVEQHLDDAEEHARIGNPHLAIGSIAAGFRQLLAAIAPNAAVIADAAGVPDVAGKIAESFAQMRDALDEAEQHAADGNPGLAVPVITRALSDLAALLDQLTAQDKPRPGRRT